LLVAALCAIVVIAASAGGCSGTMTTTSITVGASSTAPSSSSGATSSTSAALTVPATERPAALPSTTSTAAKTSSTSTTSTTSTIVAFAVGEALKHVKKLSVDIGIRHAGTDAEMQAVEYEKGYLEGLGYEVRITDVPIAPNGRTSHNVIAVKPGRSPLTIVVGAHMDSWGPAPGANDNASGAGTVLELARDLKDASLVPTIEFVLFGNEEPIDENPDHHHFGSRAFVKQMTPEERAALVGAMSLDMVAYGNTFVVRTMNKGPQKLRALVKSYAAAHRVAIAYKQDPTTIGWSDHEPFELAGFPAVWIEWQLDTSHHTKADVYERLSRKRLQATGDFVLGFLRGLSADDLDALAAART
jgi:hypothetical protein